MNRRSQELSLLLISMLITSLGVALVSLEKNEALTNLAWSLIGGYSAVFILTHAMIRWRAPQSDPLLLPLVSLACGLGLIMVYRLRPELALPQTIWLGVGALAAIFVIALQDRFSSLKNYKYSLGFFGLVLLLLPSFIGVERGGAKLWIEIGPFTFQPAEIAKIFLVLFLAAYLEDKGELLSKTGRRFLGIQLPEAKHLGPLVTMWLVSLVVLVFEKDLGTSLLFFGLFLAMLYIATGHLIYTGIGTVLFAGGATLCYHLFGHVRVRVNAWLNPWADVYETGYQLAQSLFALASGGLIGSGLGKGLPGYIPAVHTDFIFVATAEELGLAGAFAVIVLYLLLTYRGFKIALVAEDDFSRLTAIGLSSVFALQTIVILAGTTRLIPMTGVTLPFMSYGGSSILMNFVLFALLLIISSKRRVHA